jgi:PIN domain nuclease of toxin-antitoxin system
MKRLLLDTAAFLWWLQGDEPPGSQLVEQVSDSRNEVFVSAATTWEISIKRALGKLSAPEDMSSVVDENGFIELPITLFHGDQAGLLPDFHKDPFDRMLIAQAQAEGLVLVTHDSNIEKYGIRTLDPF